MKRWSKSEDRIVIKQWDIMTRRALASEIGCTDKQLAYRGQVLGLKVNKKMGTGRRKPNYPIHWAVPK